MPTPEPAPPLSASLAIDRVEFKKTLASFMSGVTVVSVDLDGEIHGMTANAFASVSLDPPLILVSVDKRAHMHERLQRSRRFGVSVLAAGQEATSAHFAGAPQEGLAIRWRSEGYDTPVLGDALASLDCEVHQAVEAGDHTVYLGRVKRLDYRDGEPLGYFRGKYRQLKPI